MATLTIDERIHLEAAPDAVWPALLDPERIVRCIPGAKLLEATDATHFVGQMRLKVGTVKVIYTGDIELTSVDHDAHTLAIAGRWKEKSGAGTAKMAMTATVAAADGGSDVVFSGSVDVVGRIVQFGRGMMQAVSGELFKTFSANMREDIESAAAASDAAAQEGETTPDAAAAPDPAAEEATEPMVVPRADEPELNALGLVLRAIWSSITGFFRRLFGRSAT